MASPLGRQAQDVENAGGGLELDLPGQPPAFEERRRADVVTGPRPPRHPPTSISKRREREQHLNRLEHWTSSCSDPIAGPRPPCHPPSSSASHLLSPLAMAKPAVVPSRASRVASESLLPPGGWEEPPQIIGASAVRSRGLGPASEAVTTPTFPGADLWALPSPLSEPRSAAPQLEVDVIFQFIDEHAMGSVSRLELIGAVVSDPRVAAFVFPGFSPSLTQEDELKIEKVSEAFSGMSRGSALVSYEDFAAVVCSDQSMHRLFSRFNPQGPGVILKSKVLLAVAQDPSLADFWLPHASRGESRDAEERKIAVDTVLTALTGGDGDRITFERFARHFRIGTALRVIYSRMDVDCVGTVTRLEMLGAMALSPTVLTYVSGDFSARFTTIDEARLQSLESIFVSMAGINTRFTQENFRSYFTPGLAAEQDGLACASAAEMEMGLLDGTFRDRMTAGADVSSSRGALQDRMQNPRGRDWLDPSNWPEVHWLRKRFQGPAHPLDAPAVRIADEEVRTAIWGREQAGQKKVVYEDEYDFFPYFTVIISAVQLGFYVGTVGDRITWTGPIGQPEDFWMMVYDWNCQDLRKQIWRLWTYQWIHAHIFHVIGNAVGNVFIGGLLEAVHGTRAICTLYTFGVITGALTCGALQPHLAVVGASGGVYSMIGARIANLILNGDQMPRTFWFRVMVVSLYLVYDVVSFFTSFSTSVSYSAHAGGLLCGALFGPFWLENLVVERWETKYIKWCKRIYLMYMVFCVVLYLSQAPGNPRGLFDSAGYCRFGAA